MRSLIRLSMRVSICAVMIAVMGITCSAKDPEYTSPGRLLLSKDGKSIYIAEYTAKQIAIFDVEGGKILRTFPLPSNPTDVALSSDGDILYVTGSLPEGQVYVVDVKGGKVKDRIDVGHTPSALALSPDGKTLYVCNRFNNDVSVVDLISKKETSRIPVLREPVSAALTPDGKFLYVVNHLPTGSANENYTAASVSVIDTAEKKTVKSIILPNGSTGLQDVCISSDGKYAYITHILGRYQLPTTQLERGWMNTNALSIIDVEKQELLNTVLLDDIDLGGANPWGITITGDGKYMCVTHAGTNELSVIDRTALHEKLAKVAGGEKVSEVSLTPEDVPNDLSFLVGLRKRLKLSGKGPRDVATIGETAYVAEYFSDSIGVLNIDPEARPNAKSIPLGPEQPLTMVRKGEALFHDATICFQHWQSCSSCHPSGARIDGLNWDLLNDGMGNPKQSKSLLYSHRTPPAMVSGIRDSTETAVRSGIRFILFAVRPDEEPDAIDEYLKSLEPVPSPHLVKGKLSKSAKAGEKVFEKAGCAKCHPSPLYTDLATHNIGTGVGRLDENREFDTPTLIEVWRTAPYLYDGRSATMTDVLKKHNPKDEHGVTSDLSDQEIADLAEFVLSL